MRPPNEFKEYVKNKIVVKKSPDHSRAKSLIKEAKKSLSYLKEVEKKIGITDQNANNIIKDAYDIIMEITRAKNARKWL